MVRYAEDVIPYIRFQNDLGIKLFIVIITQKSKVSSHYIKCLNWSIMDYS